jgi:thiol-disulfide isomerase/thioredoxin
MRFACILICTTLALAAAPPGGIRVQFFISSDCPISNSYAPVIQRLCGEYGAKGIGCSLVYEDVGLTAASMQKHLAEYGYARIAAVIDTTRKLAKRAGATVTPEAVVVDRRGEIRYRGRIDNFYADLGKPRQQVTAHDLRDALDAVLAGRTVANPETKAWGCYIVPPDILKK